MVPIILHKQKIKLFVALFFAIYVLCFLNCSVAADTLETVDGRMIEGKYRGGTQEYIWFQVGDELKGFAIKDTASIRLGTSPDSVTGIKEIPDSRAASLYTHPSPKPETITVPSGTRLIVRMDSDLDSRRHGAGHKFSVTLENNIVVKGKTLSFRDSKLYGRLKKVKISGRLFGTSKLDLELTDAMINGVPYPIITSGVHAVGESTTKKTVGTTAAGAGIGAIANGSDGAKTGAAIGLGLSLLRGGSDIHITTGTILEFKLISDLTFVP
jgi:hypothetical protein